MFVCPTMMGARGSLELKAEARTNFYGINAASLLVECVSLTRGGMLTHWHAGRWPQTYRIRDGKVARTEVERVFRLTDIVAIEALKDTFPGHAGHPEIVVLELLAANRRELRDGAMGSAAGQWPGDG